MCLLWLNACACTHNSIWNIRSYIICHLFTSISSFQLSAEPALEKSEVFSHHQQPTKSFTSVTLSLIQQPPTHQIQQNTQYVTPFSANFWIYSNFNNTALKFATFAAQSIIISLQITHLPLILHAKSCGAFLFVCLFWLYAQLHPNKTETHYIFSAAFYYSDQCQKFCRTPFKCTNINILQEWWVEYAGGYWRD